jgi:hypothetical protein
MFSFRMGRKNISVNPQIFLLLLVWGFTLAYYSQTKDLSFEALLFPRFLFLGILVSGVAILRKSVTITPLVQPHAVYEEINDCSTLPPPKVVFFTVGTAVCIFLFVKTIAVLSVVPSTCLLLYITGVRKLKIYLTVPVSLALFIYFFFEKWLMVSLPHAFL